MDGQFTYRPAFFYGSRQHNARWTITVEFHVTLSIYDRPWLGFCWLGSDWFMVVIRVLCFLMISMSCGLC